MTNLDSFDQEFAAGVVSDALRRHIGPGKAFTYAQAAEALGEDGRTIKSWCAGDTTPRTHSHLRLMCFLGVAYVNDLLRPAGYQAKPLDGGCGDDFKLNAGLAGALTVIAEALGDDATPGRIDHRERAAVLTAVRVAHSLTSKWLAVHSPVGAVRVPPGRTSTDDMPPNGYL